MGGKFLDVEYAQVLKYGWAATATVRCNRKTVCTDVDTSSEAVRGHFRYDLDGMPCDDILNHRLQLIPDNLAARVAGELADAFTLRIPVTLAEPGSLPRFEFKSKRWIKQ